MVQISHSSRLTYEKVLVIGNVKGKNDSLNLNACSVTFLTNNKQFLRWSTKSPTCHELLVPLTSSRFINSAHSLDGGYYGSQRHVATPGHVKPLNCSANMLNIIIKWSLKYFVFQTLCNILNIVSMQSAKMSNLRHDSQSPPFCGHNWVGEQILFHYICCINIFISDSTLSFIQPGSESIEHKQFVPT